MPDTNLNEEQVRNLIEQWVDAVCRGDMDGVLASHSPAIVMYDVPKPVQCKGMQAYAQTWKLFFATVPPGSDRFRLHDLEIHADNDIAFAHGLLAIAGARACCRLTIGLRRVEGHWAVLHEHHSLPIEL